MFTDEERDFLEFYGFNLAEEQWHLMNGINVAGQRNIVSDYTFKVRGEQGLRMLLERLAAAENTRRPLIEIVRTRVQ